MKFGIRKPSIRRRIAARTSWKRAVRHSLGLKAPRGWGWLTNPKKAAYNRLYNRTSISVDRLLKTGKRRTRKRTPGMSGSGCLVVIIVILAIIGAMAR